LSRKRLSPGALYTLLSAELKRLRAAECTTCRMPLPFLVERPDDVSANWRIGTAPACAHGCDSLIAEIATRLWPDYDLVDPLAQAAKAPAASPAEKA
jgi:hypothetical protein